MTRSVYFAAARTDSGVVRSEHECPLEADNAAEALAAVFGWENVATFSTDGDCCYFGTSWDRYVSRVVMSVRWS